MTRESHDPPLGTPAPEPPHDRLPPAPQPYPSGSGDELSVSLSATLSQPSPDPLLGEFRADTPPAPPVAEASVDSEDATSWDLAPPGVVRPLPPQLQADQTPG